MFIFLTYFGFAKLSISKLAVSLIVVVVVVVVFVDTILRFQAMLLITLYIISNFQNFSLFQSYECWIAIPLCYMVVVTTFINFDLNNVLSITYVLKAVYLYCL